MPGADTAERDTCPRAGTETIAEAGTSLRYNPANPANRRLERGYAAAFECWIWEAGSVRSSGSHRIVKQADPANAEEMKVKPRMGRASSGFFFRARSGRDSMQSPQVKVRKSPPDPVSWPGLPYCWPRSVLLA